MKNFILLFVLIITASCATKNYKPTDYAYACIENSNKKLDKKITDICMPIDTYENQIKYHSMRPSERRKMPTMDDVMD